MFDRNKNHGQVRIFMVDILYLSLIKCLEKAEQKNTAYGDDLCGDCIHDGDVHPDADRLQATSLSIKGPG